MYSNNYPPNPHNKFNPMRVVGKIAKNELRYLFYSPIAWFLAIILMVLCSFYYTTTLYNWAKTSYMLFSNRPDFIYWATDSVTYWVFSDLQQGFFANILQHLYLFIPLLTMGVINREHNNGTIRLLYSSPVKLSKFVLGKFLALAIYNLVLVAIVGIFIISGFFDIKSLDYPPLFSAALGIYLFMCALMAIGFFMSSLTTYQIVSAIASFTLLFILSRIGQLWQEYELVRDLTWFLSVSGRTEKFFLGLITTKDILYYLVIIFMFVSFTLIKLKSGREHKPWFILAGRYLAVVVIGLAVGYTGSLPVLTGYLDTTARKVNTIHPRTQDFLKRLNDGPLEVTLYTNLFAEGARTGFPANRNAYISKFWESYQRFKTDIDFKYEYYYAVPENDSSLYKRFPGKSLQQIAGMLTRLYHLDSASFKSEEEMRKTIDLKPEDYKLVMQLKYKGRSVFLRTNFFEAEWPDEQNTCAAFQRLLQAHMPKVCFVTGQLERNIHKQGEREFFGHSLMKKKIVSLINVGFDVDTINLSVQDIPADISVLVLADPKVAFSAPVLSKLKRYVNEGGNMFVLGEPGKQYVLNPVLQEAGIRFRDGQLVQANVNESPDMITPFMTYEGLGLAEEFNLMRYKYIWSHHIYKDSIILPFYGAITLEHVADSGFSIKPLLLSRPGESWLKAGKLVKDSAMPVFTPYEGDTREPSFPLVFQMARPLKNKEQRIVIAGDADFCSNLRNIDDVVRAIYSWLTYNEYPVYTPVPYAVDNRVVLSPQRAAAQRIIYTWILPGVVLILGAVVLIRRKRK